MGKEKAGKKELENIVFSEGRVVIPIFFEIKNCLEMKACFYRLTQNIQEKSVLKLRSDSKIKKIVFYPSVLCLTTCYNEFVGVCKNLREKAYEDIYCKVDTI